MSKIIIPKDIWNEILKYLKKDLYLIKFKNYGHIYNYFPMNSKKYQIMIESSNKREALKKLILRNDNDDIYYMIGNILYMGSEKLREELEKVRDIVKLKNYIINHVNEIIKLYEEIEYKKITLF